MKHTLNILVLVAAACSDLPAQVKPGDAARGEQLLRDRGCVLCHQLNGQGRHSAPDLGKRMSRSYTPGLLAAVIWNHAPSMWAREGGQRALSEDQAADLFAYFSSRRYFERPGDAARGKQVFAAKHCADCHGISKPVLADANPVVAWRSLGDSIALAQAMWNRPQLMARALARKRIRWPRLSSQELADLVVYVENLPDTRGKQPRFCLASPQTGRTVFEAKGCGGCHCGKLSLENRVTRSTPIDLAAAMWNHPLGSLEAHPVLSYEEMSGIVGYLWSMDDRGDPRRGRRLFTTKKCAGCHGNPGVAAEGFKPLLAGERQLVPLSILTALWRCGLARQAEMSRKGLAWPHFAGSELADLGAYLTTRRSSAPKEMTYGSAAGCDQLPDIRHHR